MYNVLVTGANGQLGSEIRVLEADYRDYDFYFTDIHNLDLTNHRAVKAFIEEQDIAIIINCAAYTAVDKAETETTMANAINHLSVENLAKISKSSGITLIHISTDYVYDGTSNKPYTEEDVPNPESVYGQTKLDGEKALQKINPANAIIIRTSWVYSSYGTNFVKTMLRLAQEKNELNVISDQVGTPTYAGDLAKTILEILPKINNEQLEIYHYSNEGVCSWYDFAKAIFELGKKQIKINPIETSQYPTPAKRPLYSLLNKNRIKATYGIDIPYWKDSLSSCMEKINAKKLD